MAGEGRLLSYQAKHAMAGDERTAEQIFPLNYNSLRPRMGTEPRTTAGWHHTAQPASLWCGCMLFACMHAAPRATAPAPARPSP